MRSIRISLAALICAVGTVPIQAQERSWGLVAEAGLASFSGHSKSTSEPQEGHPGGASTWGIRLDRTRDHVRLTLGVLYATSGLEIESSEASAQAKGILKVYEISPEISFVLFQPRDGAVRLHLGGVIDHWSPTDADGRTRLGGLAALSLEVPLSDRISVQVRGEATLTGSLFNEDEVPSDYERKSGIRQRWSLGTRYRL